MTLNILVTTYVWNITVKRNLRFVHNENFVLYYTQHKSTLTDSMNLLNPTGHVIHQQFNIQQLYVLPTLYLCVLYLYENKQGLVPLTP